MITLVVVVGIGALGLGTSGMWANIEAQVSAVLTGGG